MKRIICFAFCAMIGVCFTACKKDKQNALNNIIVKPKEVVEPDTVVHKMGEIDTTIDTVKWVGSTYKVKVKRYTNDSLTVVTDDNGKRFRNNLIKVVIVRKDGSEFFNKVFSKKMFENLLDEDFLSKNLLLGMVFNGSDEDCLHFLGSVGKPDILTEEFVPFDVTISRMGDVGIKKAPLDKLDGVETNGDDKDAPRVEQEDGVE